MRLPKLLALMVLVSLAATAWPAAPQGKGPPVDLKGKTPKQVLEELLPGLSAADLTRREAPQQRWQEICNYAGAPGNEALRKQVCQAMLEQLGPSTANSARLWLLKQLQQIGKGECVDGVAVLLEDKDNEVRDGAVRVLAANPAPAATAKLIEAMPTATSKNKIGLLNALGYRADPSAVETVAKELTSTSDPVAVAAARALGRIATPEAAKALAAERGGAKGQVQFAISDAYLLCADRFLKDGKTAAAAAIYQELNKPAELRSVRMAALQGVLKSSGDKAGAMVLELLSGSDADARAIATGQVENLNPAALRTVAAGIDKLPAPSQVLVLGALASRGDKSQRAVALAAVKSQDENVKKAGLLALSKLGDASVVAVLIDTMFTSAKLAAPAKESLTRIIGEGVDEKIVEAMQGEKNVDKRAKLIAILESRKAVAGVLVLLKEALSDEALVRSSAMSALQHIAEPKHVSDMVQGVLKAAKGKERDDAERAVVAVCAKIPEQDKRADLVLVLLMDAKAEKAALLPLVGRFGGPKVLAQIKLALASQDAALYEAALLAMCNWPDSTGSEELLKLAKDAREKSQKTLALRALIRVNGNLNEGVPATKLGFLESAMALASTTDERKLVLSSLETVRHIEALRFVLPYLDDKNLVQSACRTIVELAHSKNLREPNRAEFTRALDRVIVLCRDKGLVERAKQYKQG